MPNPLFSTYRGGENRVTSSIMAVFERIDLALVRDILANATGAGDELRAVTFENQVPGEGAVADARISGRFEWLFETKRVRGAYEHEGHGTEQLDAYVELLEQEPEAVLFVLTPDADVPAAVAAASARVENRIVWASFKLIAGAINDLVDQRRVGEQTAFLLSELVDLFEVDGLLSADDTVIVAARTAWPEYRSTGAYVCQPERSFRSDISYLGFYAGGAIQPQIAKIRAWYPSVLWSAEEAERRRESGEGELADLIEHLLAAGTRIEGESYGVFLLTGPGEDGTLTLERPIANDMTTAAGKPWAWTLSQRYTSSDRLQEDIHHTSELGPEEA